MVASTMELLSWLRKHLEAADTDLLREMVLVDDDLYLVGAVTDHITPGRARTTPPSWSRGHAVHAQLLGPYRGHRQPAQPKARHWTNDENPPDPDTWLAGPPSTRAPGGRIGSAGPRPTAASAASRLPWAAPSIRRSPTPPAPTSTSGSRRVLGTPGVPGPGSGAADLLDDHAGAGAGLAGGALQLAGAAAGRADVLAGAGGAWRGLVAWGHVAGRVVGAHAARSKIAAMP